MNRVEGYEERIEYTDEDIVKCSGDNNDHPITYYRVPFKGFVVCKYCDIKFIHRESRK